MAASLQVQWDTASVVRHNIDGKVYERKPICLTPAIVYSRITITEKKVVVKSSCELVYT